MKPPASARATGTSHDELLCELEAACAYIFAGEERDSSACDSYRSLPSDASAGNELEVIPSDSVHGVAAIEQGIPVTPPPPEPEPIEDRTGILWVEVNPPEATIFVDGRRAGQGRAQKTLPVGPHTVRAELGELYHPSEQAVSLSKDGLTVALTLAPAFGSLWVRSEPPGAEVWLAGEPVGNTPWLVERKKSGTYSIQLSLPPRFQPHFGEVTVEDGEETSLDVVLEGNGASLLVSSEPPGANIRLAGLDTEETTPHEFAFVPAGIVEVRLALEGYREAVLLPTITAGKKALARVTLEPIPGILVILTRELGNGPCHCGAFVDGEAVGETPIKLQLPATKHRIRVDCGGREEEETVTLLPGDQVEVLIELPPRATAENDARTGIQWVQISELPESATGGSAEGREQRPFVVSRSEVTVGQYRRCVDAGGCSPPADISRMCNGLEESRDQHPVNCVTWSQAKMYAQWANAALLPGDLWALAARGSDANQPYPWGDEPPDCARIANWSPRCSCDGFQTCPVCSASAGHSEEGLCDMAGNVAEWVDGHANSDGERAVTSAGFHGPLYRVARGGGGALLETDVFDLVEGGDAVHFHQGQARSDVGFRVYRWIDPAP